MLYIYVLELQQGKYYVGKTTNPYFRIDCHFKANGSEWTKKYEPKRVLELISNCDHYDEDKYTKIYMDKYGVENVRGGSYVSLSLDKATTDHLKRTSNGVNNRCFKCGKVGHFANKCPVKTQLHENICETKIVGPSCFTCGKYGHYANNCYVRRSASKRCDICGKYGHYEINCYQF